MPDGLAQKLLTWPRCVSLSETKLLSKAHNFLMVLMLSSTSFTFFDYFMTHTHYWYVLANSISRLQREEEVRVLTHWCQENCLTIKELIVDFRRREENTRPSSSTGPLWRRSAALGSLESTSQKTSHGQCTPQRQWRHSRFPTSSGHSTDALLKAS